MRRNAQGYRVGEDHHWATLTDRQVRDMRELYRAWKDAGSRKGYGALGDVFGCSPWTCRDIVKYKTRIYS